MTSNTHQNGAVSREKRTCPCKKLPWSLSSFTAAEFGDVHSLLRKRPGTSTNVWNRRDSAGYTPLHLAAQHNHVAATSLLLKLGADVNGQNLDDGENDEANYSSPTTTTEQRVATPLHRAAFSGATATMRLLLQEKNCNLLAKDTSFGDLKTPLHKASAGGRYLSVQLLLEELRIRGQLQTALQAKDFSSLTPLQVAEEIVSRPGGGEGEERESLARWDVVAGGVADWSKCISLLRAAAETDENDKNESTTTRMEDPSATSLVKVSDKSNSKDDAGLPPLPLHLSTIDGCLDCDQFDDDGGMCLTASWQAAFQAALGTAVDRSISMQQPRDNVVQNVNSPSLLSNISPPKLAIRGASASTMAAAIATKPSVHPPAGGVACRICGKQTISLYPTAQGRLVCKTCYRLGC